MRLSDRLGGAYDLLPRCCEDAGTRQSNAPCTFRSIYTLNRRNRREGVYSQAFAILGHIVLRRDGVPAHW
jgi:hypothetical protein